MPHLDHLLLAPKRLLRRAGRVVTYSAYCMAPFFPSWLGNGTSRRACFIGGGVPGLPGIMAGEDIVVAFLDELEEMQAMLPARNGSRAVMGLAVHVLVFRENAAFWWRKSTSQGHRGRRPCCRQHFGDKDKENRPG